MTISFKKKEVYSLILGIIILAFVFGFDDGKETFNIYNWIINFIRLVLIVAISLITHTISHKLIAKITPPEWCLNGQNWHEGSCGCKKNLNCCNYFLQGFSITIGENVKVTKAIKSLETMRHVFIIRI